MIFTTIFRWPCKPTYITGGPHPLQIASLRMGSFFPSDFRFDGANAIWGHARVRQESLMKCIYDGWFITIITMMYSSSNEPCPACQTGLSPSEMEQKIKKKSGLKAHFSWPVHIENMPKHIVQSVPPSFLNPEDLPLAHGSFTVGAPWDRSLPPHRQPQSLLHTFSRWGAGDLRGTKTIGIFFPLIYDS